MVYEKYGQVFRRIRKQHGMSLSNFEGLGISKGTLSNFENAKSMLSFEKLDAALAEMQMSVGEYTLLLNNGTPDYYITNFLEIDQAYFTNDSDKLEEIYLKNIKYETTETEILAISAKSFNKVLSKNEKKKLDKFLATTSIWSLYELYTLVCVIDQLEVSVLRRLVSDLFEEKYDYIRELVQYRIIFIRVLIRIAMLYIRKNLYDESSKLINKLVELCVDYDLSTRIAIKFLKGCWLYKFENKYSGKKNVQRVLNLMVELEAQELRALSCYEFRRIEESATEKVSCGVSYYN